jgi:hypothetical protein
VNHPHSQKPSEIPRQRLIERILEASSAAFADFQKGNLRKKPADFGGFLLLAGAIVTKVRRLLMSL